MTAEPALIQLVADRLRAVLAQLEQAEISQECLDQIVNQVWEIETRLAVDRGERGQNYVHARFRGE